MIFDPACGSGNLLLNNKVSNPKQIYGIDLDPVAIMCCKINYYLKFGHNAPSPNIFCKNFMNFIIENPSIHFDLLLCNPPFGASLSIGDFLSARTVETEDSLTFFVEHGAKMASDSIFILPESVANVKKHQPLRKFLLENVNVTNICTHGSGFSGTMFPIISMHIKSLGNCSDIRFDNASVSKKQLRSLPYMYFRPISADTERVLNKIYSKSIQSLKGSDFAQVS